MAERIGRRGVPVRRGRLVHYTDAEWHLVRETARQCGKAAGRFVRDASLGVPPAVQPFLAQAELIRELGRSGQALARLAVTARETNARAQADSLDAALAELLALVRRLTPGGPGPARP